MKKSNVVAGLENAAELKGNRKRSHRTRKRKGKVAGKPVWMASSRVDRILNEIQQRCGDEQEGFGV
jgi:hypothetical protein